MDAAVIGLISGIAVAAIGGAVTVVTTVINRSVEKDKTAKATMDEMHQRELGVKEERLAFKDEQLADCERDKLYWKSRALELEQGS